MKVVCGGKKSMWIQGALLLVAQIFTAEAVPFGRRQGLVAPLVDDAEVAVTCGQCMEERCAALSLRCRLGERITAVKTASFAAQRAGTCESDGGLRDGFVPGAVCIPTAQYTAKAKAAVQAACVGRQSCKVQANWGLLGDPCPGLLKTLAVEVTCTDAQDAGAGAGRSIPQHGMAPSHGVDGTAACPPTNGMWHLMIILGDGLEHDEAIWKAIQATDGLHMIYQKQTQLPRVSVAAHDLFRIDVSKVEPKTVRVLAIWDTVPKLVAMGKGGQKAWVNQRMVKLKRDLRMRFDAKPARLGLHDPAHNHVLHISNSNVGIDKVLQSFRLPPTWRLFQSHDAFFTPWFMQVPAHYGIRYVDLRTLTIFCAAHSVGACARPSKRRIWAVPLADSAHYSFASGRNRSEYAAYFREGVEAGRLNDDHTAAAFAALQRNFDTHAYPACTCGFDGNARRSMIIIRGRRIQDGNHRAALMLAANGGKATVVEVVDIGMSGGHLGHCVARS